jgi:23S rRNA pseudouridine2605 synthase
MIVGGHVSVNGTAVTELGTRIRPGVDVVDVDGVRVELPPIRWVMFHKPTGVLTTERDPRGGRTIYDLLPHEFKGLRYVGRLDRDTEGLLLLTNDGDLAAELLHPRNAVQREYEVVVRGRPDRRIMVSLTSGVDLEDGPARARVAEVLDVTRAHTTVRIVLVEGRKREVRRMMERVGYPVVALRRCRFGPVRLGTVTPGSWRELEEDEVSALTEVVSRDESNRTKAN